jgi:hypothetical protein
VVAWVVVDTADDLNKGCLNSVNEHGQLVVEGLAIPVDIGAQDGLTAVGRIKKELQEVGSNEIPFTGERPMQASGITYPAGGG